MATHPDAAVRAFDFFIERHSTDFRRISGASRGEWKIDDVRNEAWLIGFDLGESRGRPLDHAACADDRRDNHWLNDQRMPDVAAFLMISVSWCYTCCRDARHQARNQLPLPHGLSVGDDDTALRPWRTFKLDTAILAECEGQLAFDYWNRPRQPGEGQLWLLWSPPDCAG